MAIEETIFSPALVGEALTALADTDALVEPFMAALPEGTARVATEEAPLTMEEAAEAAAVETEATEVAAGTTLLMAFA